MDVILLEDVKTLGKKGQIVKINDGYARNYVLPKKLGIEQQLRILMILSYRRKEKKKKQQKSLQELRSLQQALKTSQLHFL